MARASLIQNTCNAGELSPLLLGRQDIAKYKNGLQVCKNAIPLTQGAWTRRPGTVYQQQARHHDKVCRLFPFQFSVTQTYVLEFGEYYIRFFTGNAPLTLTGQNITGITQAATAVVTYSGSDTYANGDRVYITGVVGMTQVNRREFVVTNVNTGANTFELYNSDGTAVNSTGYGAWSSGGTVAEIYQVTTTYAEADLADIRIVQSADTLYILHPDFPPATLTRVSATSWTLADITFLDGPYEATNTTTTTLTPDAATNGTPVAISNAANNGSGLIRITAAGHGLLTGDGTEIEGVVGTTEANTHWIVTRIDANNFDLQGSTFTNAYVSGGTSTRHPFITASAVTGINGGQGFLSTDVGRLIRIREGSTWGYVEIVHVVSTTVVIAHVYNTLSDTTSKVDWRMGLWSDTTGFPTCATFHEDRLFFAGAATSPQRIDGSKTGLYTNFAPSGTDGTVADDNAVSFTLNADDVNAVKWLATNEKGLLVGTTRGEWQVKPSALNEAITPTNITGKPSTRHGSADVAPVTAGNAVLFVQRAGRKLREFAYVFEVDGFKAPDMTLLAEHITRPSITELAYQTQPQAIVWGVRSDGVLLGFTYERDQDVVAWHRHELGGYSNAGGTAIPEVESVAVVPNPTASRDELYMVVKRYINGSTKRYIEYMSKIWEYGDEQVNAFHLDCGYTITNGSPSSTVTGLWHLEGQSVTPYVDGANHPNVTVTNGTITLNHAATVVTLGYAYNSDGQIMPIEGGSQDGTAQAKTKRIHSVGFWLMDTLGLKFGPDSDNLNEILATKWGQNFGEATALVTDVISERMEDDYNKRGQVYWRADGPFPATVLAIMPKVNVSD